MTNAIWSPSGFSFSPSIKCSVLICIQPSTFILSYFSFNPEISTKHRNTEYILYNTYTELRKPLMVPHLFVDDLTEIMPCLRHLKIPNFPFQSV